MSRVPVSEAAERLGISPQRVRELCRKGKLKGKLISNPVGRSSWQIEEDSLQALISTKGAGHGLERKAEAVRVVAESVEAVPVGPAAHSDSAGPDPASVGNLESTGGGTPAEEAGSESAPGIDPVEQSWEAALHAPARSPSASPGETAGGLSPCFIQADDLLRELQTLLPAPIFDKWRVLLQLWSWAASHKIRPETIESLEDVIFYGVPAVILLVEGVAYMRKRALLAEHAKTGPEEAEKDAA